MAQPSVVVVFNSRCGATETLAHAAAVGTVNARTLPRLRRLPDDEGAVEPACAETLRRLQKEYVAPTEADVVGSQGLIIVPGAANKAMVFSRRFLPKAAQAKMSEKLYEDVDPEDRTRERGDKEEAAAQDES